MKDFAKSIRTNNSSVCNKATVLKDGNVWVVLYANETKSQEFETEEEAREFAKKVGNSKVGNADPRIASVKSKIKTLESQLDDAGLKDVEKLIEDEIKECQKKTEDMYKQINAIQADRQGWLDLRGDVLTAKVRINFAKKQ